MRITAGNLVHILHDLAGVERAAAGAPDIAAAGRLAMLGMRWWCPWLLPLIRLRPDGYDGYPSILKEIES